ncbi:MAG: gas vesicle protein GvpN [Bacteroidota bacterium]
MDSEKTIELEANNQFVETPYIADIMHRSLSYIKAGFPVHFRGPAGTGKSTLAKHLATKIGRPVALLYGDEELTTSNLIGGETGYKLKRVRDNFISTVLKEEEEITKRWVDNRLTDACRNGYTLIYDEFTRSRPEANNVLLSVLQDKILTMSHQSNEGSPYLEVHPDFVAIFTSNPEEYAGTFKSQDALRDRMVTIDLDYPDYETELKIIYEKGSMPLDVCELITDVVRSLREDGSCDFSPTIRAGIMIAKTMTALDMEPEDDMELFTKFCQDILVSETGSLTKNTNQNQVRSVIKSIINNRRPLNRTFMAV